MTDKNEDARDAWMEQNPEAAQEFINEVTEEDDDKDPIEDGENEQTEIDRREEAGECSEIGCGHKANHSGRHGA